MNVHQQMRLRQFQRLKYHDPVYVLETLRRIELTHELSPLPEKVRNLRTNRLKFHREGRDAALFCLGLSQAVGSPVSFSPNEADDHDFVLLFQRDDTAHWWPVQLKELVPSSIREEATLDGLFAGLAKYSDSRDLCVAVRMNRTMKGFSLSSIKVPELPIGSLWLFGCSSPDKGRWFIYGDLLRERHGFEFEYPAPRVLPAQFTSRLIVPGVPLAVARRRRLILP
jgi:hypothetical protein